VNASTLIAALVVLEAGISACGQKADDDKCAANCVGDGFLVEVKGKTATVEFPVDGDYIVMPYVLGDTATVDTASADPASDYRFSVSTGATSLYRMAKGQTSEKSPLNGRQLDHAFRHLHNTFSASVPPAKSGEFWRSLQSLTATADKSWRQPLPEIFSRQVAKHQQRQKKGHAGKHLAAALSDCTDEGTITVPVLDELSAADVDAYKNNSDYCLVFVKGNPVSVTDKAAIAAHVEKLLELYKTVYADDFSETSDGGYKFKPVVVVVPFDDASVWPNGTNDPDGVYQVSGAFIKAQSELHLRPTVYLPSDLKAITAFKNLSAAEAAELFHSTLAHELQHAVMNYYRYWRHVDEDGFDADTAEEIGTLDEGLAHFLEDVMGYGEINFDNFPKLFLTSFFNASEPVLGADAQDPTVRGAAQCLFYFLSSVKGGLTFTDGYVSGGGGVEFIRSFVTGTKRGVAGLVQAFGDDWQAAIGAFLGAVVLAGSGEASADPSFRIQEQVTGIRNSAGEENKTFGMSFRNYGGVPDISAATADLPSSSAKALAEEQALHYYQTLPFAHTAAGERLLINFADEYDNAAVQIVRIK